jgi:hypothetical protein
MKTKFIRDMPGSAKIMKAVILYDQLESMLMANQLVGRLPSHRNCGADWTVNTWRFDLLESGREGEAALGDASDAELMIVAVGKAQALRVWPEDWLARWALGRKVATAALALVLVGEANRVEAVSAVMFPLSRLADNRRLSFFAIGAGWRPAFMDLHEVKEIAAELPDRRGNLKRDSRPTAAEQLNEFIQDLPEMSSAAA